MRCCVYIPRLTSQDTGTNKPGHTGTLSTDVSEEDSKDMANIVQFGVTQLVTGKKSAEGIVGSPIAEGLNMK